MIFSRRQEGLARLNSVSGFSPDAIRRLLDLRPAENLLDSSAEELARAGGLSPSVVSRFKERAALFDIRGELEQASRLGVRLIDFEDPEYPDLLKSIPDFPLLLYVRGKMSQEACALAFVGSRRPTYYGLRMAKSLAYDAAKSGLTVVSGLARGIDTESHRAALRAGTPTGCPAATWAVLGSGLGRIYPSENGALAREIVSSGGCLISEYPLQSAPAPDNFPRRNRIIAGLSWGAVVVEGEIHSGSLITARLAVDYGRQVFAVPGPADSSLSDAPHRLIAQGAKLVAKIGDILEELPPGCYPVTVGPVPGAAAPGAEDDKEMRSSSALPTDQAKILQWLGSEARNLEDLGNATGIDLPRLSSILFDMELEDLLISLPGQRYAKKTN